MPPRLKPFRDLIGAPPWELAALPLRRVKVAVLDSGIDGSHEALRGRVFRATAWKKSPDGTPCPEPLAPRSNNDPAGHGTGVAGVIAAMAPNAIIEDVRVLEADAAGFGSVVLAGLRAAVEGDAEVINVSIAIEKNRWWREAAELLEEAYLRYERKIMDLLEDAYPEQPEKIMLSAEAFGLLKAFADEIEPKLKQEYADITDWAGKLVGNTLRMAGLLCRTGVFRAPEFMHVKEPLVVSGETMCSAISLGRYFLNHALAVFDVIPEGMLYRNAQRILEMIKKRQLKEFNRRDAMRFCKSFKTVDEIQPVLDFLDDYGYIIRLPERMYLGGRPPLPKYAVNPVILGRLQNEAPA